MLRFTVVSAILFAIVPLSLVRAQAKSTAAPPAMNLTQFRDANPTHLTRHGPPPEMWQDPRPLKLPAGVKEVTYTSGDLKLKAWLSDVPTRRQAAPRRRVLPWRILVRQRRLGRA